MNAPRAITARTPLERWRALAVVENNRMRAAMGLNPIIGAQTGPVLEMGRGKRATTRDAITAAIKKHGPWVDTHVIAEAIGLSLNSTRSYLRDMCAEGLVSRRHVDYRAASQWRIGGGASEPRVLFSDRVLAHLRSTPERWLTIDMIAEETGIPSSAVDGALRVALKAGLLERQIRQASKFSPRVSMWRPASGDGAAAVYEPRHVIDGRAALLEALTGDWQSGSDLRVAVNLSESAVSRHFFAMLADGLVDRRYLPGEGSRRGSVWWRLGTGQQVNEPTVRDKLIAALMTEPTRRRTINGLCAELNLVRVTATSALQRMRKDGIARSVMVTIDGRQVSLWSAVQ